MFLVRYVKQAVRAQALVDSQREIACYLFFCLQSVRRGERVVYIVSTFALGRLRTMVVTCEKGPIVTPDVTTVSTLSKQDEGSDQDCQTTRGSACWVNAQ